MEDEAMTHFNRRSGNQGKRVLAVARAIWLASLGFAVTTLAANGPSSKVLSFRVMTWNIHHGEGTDGRVELERIAEVIKQERADLVLLQEVDKGVPRTGRRDLPAELARLTGLSGVFSNNFHLQGGEYGNALLTRFPVARWRNHHYQMLRQGEQRGLLQAVVTLEARELAVFCTHLDYRPDDAERLSNVVEIKRLAQEYGAMPLLVGGDFNAAPSSRTAAAMAEVFDDGWKLAGQGDGFTFSSARLRSRIDFLWVRRAGPLRLVKAWVVSTPASDHLPLVTEWEWP